MSVEAPRAQRALPHVADEVRAQPESWIRAIPLAAQLGDRLPAAGERVAVIGCGTSWFMAAAYAARREELGLGQTDAFAASQYPVQRRYDRLIAITRSGTTTEVCRALAEAHSPSLALTAVPDSPVTDVADDAVVLDFADEQSVVQTLFATTTLMLLRASLGEDLAHVIEQGRAIIDGAASLPLAVQDATQFTFLGQGWVAGIASEAALKLREAAQLWTESYPQMEYRHGPIAIAQPDRACWIFGTAADGLRADLAATGVQVVDDDLDPVSDLVRAQLLAVGRAQALGLDADNPRHLTRSVVLV